MKTAGSLKLSLTFLVLTQLLPFGGCKNDQNGITGESGRRSLSDPSIMPEVIYTLPGNGAVGPLNIYNAGDGVTKPHFVVQFNKFINEDDLPSGVAKCEGFDDPVIVTRVRASSFGKGNSLTDIIGFEINDGGSPQPRKLPYAVGRTYRITIDTTLQDVNGIYLAQRYVFSFVPEPYFRVVGVYPANGASEIIGSGQSFTTRITFNSKVPGSIIDRIELSPALVGHWKIQHPDSNYVFFSLDALPSYGTSYSVAVAGNATDKFGNQMRGEFRSTFSTAEFKVLSTTPANAHYLDDLRSTIGIRFTGPLDTSTVRTNLSISPGISGPFSRYEYNGDSIIIGPSGGWAGNALYTISIGPGMRSTNGTSLSAPYAFSFHTPPFAPTSTNPSDRETNVVLNRYISLYFNNEIDASSAASAFSIVPNIEGTFNSYGANNFIEFRPTVGLAGSTDYTVTIDTTLRARNGNKLSSRYRFSFRTEQFRVNTISPANGDTSANTDSNLGIWCNGIVDTGSVRSAFSINPSIAGTLTLLYGSSYFAFTPNPGWRSGMTYTVTLEPTLRARAGGTLGSQYRASFRTIPFKVKETSPSSGQLNVLRSTSIQVSFTARINPSAVPAAFSIEPSTAGSFTTFSNANFFYFNPTGGLNPNTNYVVTVGTSIRSFTGDSLAAPYSFPFRTGP